MTLTLVMAAVMVTVMVATVSPACDAYPGFVV